jgi:hypothetical protein
MSSDDFRGVLGHIERVGLLNETNCDAELEKLETKTHPTSRYLEPRLN